MKSFAPIAIVGQSALLPGAPDPKTLADNVFQSRDAVTEARDGRFGVPHASVMGSVKAWHDRMWSTAGGYVDGFEQQWDPSGFQIPAAELEGLDPLVLWLLHTGREALRDAKITPSGRKIGAIFGNLSF